MARKSIPIVKHPDGVYYAGVTANFTLSECVTPAERGLNEFPSQSFEEVQI